MAGAEAAAGFYNHNIRLETPGGPVIVRIPIPGADTMDLRIWPESDVLTGIAGQRVGWQSCPSSARPGGKLISPAI
ncbi:hypothetical protein [Actinocrispum wychmicini]|uniref:Uncharacterized protein n=1 Tax=Actinocrispum wychmicini TaxID=1213861 RepID=A0A4R2JAD2_9PSEU|nr:hypothetical protein [Actinocrispum wychmicini]TCO54812.1 hypothetical protein EV192_108100 [Actinocrispum wychmicini]